MKRYAGSLLVLIAAVSVLVLVGTLGSAQRANAFDPTKAPEIQDRLLDGLADYELTPTGDAQSSGKLKNYTSSKNDGCGLKDQSNIKVNQNCLNVTDTDLQGRGQAQNETSLAIDPSHKSHMVASFNDYRRGDGNCYSSYSLDGGSSWSDSTPPMGFTRGTLYGAARQYWQGGGDTSVAWDTQGNAYLVVPDVPARSRHDAEPRPVECVLRLPLDRERRSVLELPGAARGAEPGDARRATRRSSTSSC